MRPSVTARREKKKFSVALLADVAANFNQKKVKLLLNEKIKEKFWSPSISRALTRSATTCTALFHRPSFN
jgi:hypothetical protein